MQGRLVLGTGLILVGAVCLMVAAFRAAFNQRAAFLIWTGSALLLLVGGMEVLR